MKHESQLNRVIIKTIILREKKKMIMIAFDLSCFANSPLKWSSVFPRNENSPLHFRYLTLFFIHSYQNMKIVPLSLHQMNTLFWHFEQQQLDKNRITKRKKHSGFDHEY